MAGLTGLSALSGLSGIMGGVYSDKVLSYSPIAYWPLWETAGVTATDQINSPAQDGAYTGVTLANAIGPDGVNSAPLFDGANDFVNIYSATLDGVFDGTEGTTMIWARAFNAGVWTDGSNDYALCLKEDNDNFVYLYKIAANNSFNYRYQANNVDETITKGGIISTDWICQAVTWSLSAGVDGEVKAYYNGVQEGATQTALGAWVGSLNAATTIIGALTLLSLNSWYGWLAHCAIWDKALTSTQILNLATV